MAKGSVEVTSDWLLNDVKDPDNLGVGRMSNTEEFRTVGSKDRRPDCQMEVSKARKRTSCRFRMALGTAPMRHRQASECM